ncbi:sure-like protein [Eremomyces bilateralis CBS 781.70]|uniref:Sure-like protein n=1 Tax=Eremomyces bilateralis CBS 781.70 TaxID=1392243 RepID=A0A6G1FUE9_9PEZI|nr:sure-like protein [Eremomyces bilateralis CBS 781.70]KAF1809404.1 sure-like protein [Eremomyces bilateralis CBS 781.70]
MKFQVLSSLLPLLLSVQAVRIVQSNDDGWAEVNLRTLHTVLKAAGHDVVLSGPAENQSGRGSLDSPPTDRTESCQHDSCPANSGPTGSDPNDGRLNWVNSYPVTSMKHGINTVASQFFGGLRPELAVAGPNVGSNIFIGVQFSGTIGAVVYSVNEHKIPGIAFSGASGDPTSFTEPTPLYSQLYADLALNVTNTVLASGTPYLPDGAWLNVNFPTVGDGRCEKLEDFQFIFTRINPGVFSERDVEWCGTDRLPQELSTVLRTDGCYATISVGDADDKSTVDRARQQTVLDKVKGILTCLP